jgi:hypothetical protein
LLKLIYAGALVFICDIVTPGQTGQTSGLRELEQGSGVLPIGSYRVVNIELAKGEPSWSEHVEKALAHIDEAKLGKTDTSKIRLALRSRIGKYPIKSSPSGLADSYEDILHGGRIIERAIRRSAILQTNVDTGLHIDYRVEPLDRNGEYRISTNLGPAHGFSKEVEHKVVERGILAVAGLNLRVQLMNGLEALTGFKDNDAELLETKLSILANEYNGETVEERMGRVITLGGLGPVTRAGGIKVDVDRLMKYRASEDCEKFRVWLKTIDERSDDEIAAEFTRVRNKIALAIGSPLGKAIRFIVTTAAGAIPGAGIVAGPALTATDTFLLDRVLGRPGPTAYLGKKYPPMFRL